MLIAAKYTPSDGSLSEQYIRSSGVPTSAADLTWSYASVLTAFDARDGLAAESWGVGNVTLPTTCSTGSDSGGGGGSGSATVVFKVTAYTNYGRECLSFRITLLHISQVLT
jgi:glucoamylase